MSEAAEVREARAEIARDPQAALAAFLAVWGRQTKAEKETGRHGGHDGRGFREQETVVMNALHKDIAPSFRMAPAQAAWLMERMQPYARQWVQARREYAARAEKNRQRFGKGESRSKKDLPASERARILRNIEAMERGAG